MNEIVNLYWVNVGEHRYGYYVFASTPNKARALCVNQNSDDEEYINLRAYLRAKDVGGENNVVVDCPEDKGYPRVLAAGYYYSDAEE